MDGFPAVVAGGARSGESRALHPLRQHHANETVKPDPDLMGIPHNRLLVSVAQAMGVTTDVVGMDRIEGWDGNLIDCTGPLQASRMNRFVCPSSPAEWLVRPRRPQTPGLKTVGGGPANPRRVMRVAEMKGMEKTPMKW